MMICIQKALIESALCAFDLHAEHHEHGCAYMDSPMRALREANSEGDGMAEFAMAMDIARLQGRIEAFAMALTECSKTARRDGGSVGARDCREIRTAIDILHLKTLIELNSAPGGDVGRVGEIESLRAQLSDARITVQAAQSCTSHYSRLLDQSVIALRIKTEEHDCCAEDLFVLRTFVNALLHQIDIGDFVDSNGHSAKMLKPVHDLMKLLGKVEQV